MEPMLRLSEEEVGAECSTTAIQLTRGSLCRHMAMYLPILDHLASCKLKRRRRLSLHSYSKGRGAEVPAPSKPQFAYPAFR